MTLGKCLIACVALVALVVVEEDFALFLPIAIAWLGFFLGVRLRPSLGAVATERRLPTGDETGAIAVGLGGSLLTIGLMSLAASGMVSLLDGRALDGKAIVADCFWLIALTAPAAPLWLRLLSGRVSGPLRSIAAGLLSSVPLGLGLAAVWALWLDALDAPHVRSDAVLTAVMMTPVCALLIAFAATSIGRALRDDVAVRPVFRTTVTVAMLAWMAVAIVLATGLAGVAGVEGLIPERGGRWAAGFGIASSLAWSVGLARARSLPVDRTLPVFLIMVLLMMTFPASLGLVGAVLSTEWVDFVGIILTPFVLIEGALSVFAIPALMRLLNFQRSQSFGAVNQRTVGAVSRNGP